MTNQIRVYTAVLSNDVVEIIDNQGDMHIIPASELGEWDQATVQGYAPDDGFNDEEYWAELADLNSIYA